jgi:two-component system sensor histidine kinase YesM
MVYVLIILLPSSSLMYLYYTKSSEIVEQEFTQSVMQTLNQAEINISYKLSSINNVSNMLIANPKLFGNLSIEADGIASFRQVQSLNELKTIIDSAQNNQEVFNVRLFVRPVLQYSRERIQFFPLSEINNKPWYNAIISNNGAIYWTPPYMERFSDRSETRIVSAARMLRNPKNYDELLGVLMVDMEETRAFDMLYSIQFANKQTVSILDSTGAIISSSNLNPSEAAAFTPQQMTDITTKAAGYFKAKSPVEHLTLFHTIPSTGWKIIVQVPFSSISSKSTTLNRVSGIIAILFTFVLFMLALSFVFAFIAENLALRIKRLIETMRNEGLEDTELRYSQGKGTIMILEKSISHMIGTVKSLTEQSLTARIHEKEALLKALQAQINPHFLYNTLEAVNWMAIRSGAHDISSMMDALSRYFRLTLNQGKDIVRVEDELNLARAYLYIQTVRYESEFDTVFDIDSNVNDYLIPNLNLQPVIENALLHGIQKNRGVRGVLTISAVKERDCIVFEVSDNGVGVPPAQIDKLLKAPSPEATAGGYGLFNVYERVKLFSGEWGGMEVRSEIGNGTSVVIRIAAVAEGG